MTPRPLMALVMATLSEAKPFIAGMELVEDRTHPFRIFKNENLLLLISGIGKAAAAMGSGYCCATFHPFCVFNLGAAGATVPGLRLGDCLHIGTIFEFDRPDFRTGDPHRTNADILTGFKENTLATQDRPMVSLEDRMLVAGQAQAVDMEGASVCQACAKFKIPCYLFKFISDTVEHHQGENIYTNIKQYRQSFYSFFSEKVISRSDPQRGSWNIG